MAIAVMIKALALVGILVVIPIVGLICANKFVRLFGWKSLVVYYFVRTSLVIALLTMCGVGSYDLEGWYTHAIWMLEDGYFPGRDFLSPYHLGFNALLTLAVAVWRSKLSVVILYVIFEALGVGVLWINIKRIYDESFAKRIVILFLTSPVCLMSARATQDESLLLLAAGLSLWAAMRCSRRWLFVVGLMSIFFTKILAPFYLFSAFLVRKWHGIFIMIGCLVLYWFLAMALGTNPFDLRFGREVGCGNFSDDILGIRTFGSVIYYMPKVSVRLGEIFSLCCLASVAFVCVGGLKFSAYGSTTSFKVACTIMPIMYLVFQLTYPMFYFMYALPVLPYFYLILHDQRHYYKIGLLLLLFQILIVRTPTDVEILKQFVLSYSMIYFLATGAVFVLMARVHLHAIEKYEED